MDEEELRILTLTRVGREKVIKYGTYDMTKARAITQDHPFYAKRDDIDEHGNFIEDTNANSSNVQENAEPISDEDASSLAESILHDNFKSGMSQSEVDEMLNGLLT